MASDAGESNRLKVFLSYSRKDTLAFADQLIAALEICGFETNVDRHDISGGEDWNKRLGALILESDTVVFVMSPEAAVSQICAWEVEETDRLSKRLVPIVAMPLHGAIVPGRLQNLNYIHFYPEPMVPGSGFGYGLAKLTKALNTDVDWLREHTVLGERAARWDSHGRHTDELIRGALLAEAEEGLANKPAKTSEISALHRAYLEASRQAEDLRAGEARRRIEDMAAAQAAREEF